MVKIKVNPGESIEQALRRFNKEVLEAGILDEVKDRQFYVKPSQVKRKRKQERDFKISHDKRHN